MCSTATQPFSCNLSWPNLCHADSRGPPGRTRCENQNLILNHRAKAVDLGQTMQCHFILFYFDLLFEGKSNSESLKQKAQLSAVCSADCIIQFQHLCILLIKSGIFVFLVVVTVILFWISKQPLIIRSLIAVLTLASSLLICFLLLRKFIFKALLLMQEAVPPRSTAL